MAEYLFKTVYFPSERVRKGSSARVTISIPTNHGTSPGFVSFARHLSSRDFRLAVGDLFVEEIEDLAEQEGLSFSNICMLRLHDYYTAQLGPFGETPTAGGARNKGSDFQASFQVQTFQRVSRLIPH